MVLLALAALGCAVAPASEPEPGEAIPPSTVDILSVYGATADGPWRIGVGVTVEGIAQNPDWRAAPAVTRGGKVLALCQDRPEWLPGLYSQQVRVRGVVSGVGAWGREPDVLLLSRCEVERRPRELPASVAQELAAGVRPVDGSSALGVGVAVRVTGVEGGGVHTGGMIAVSPHAWLPFDARGLERTQPGADLSMTCVLDCTPSATVECTAEGKAWPRYTSPELLIVSPRFGGLAVLRQCEVEDPPQRAARARLDPSAFLSLKDLNNLPLAEAWGAVVRLQAGTGFLLPQGSFVLTAAHVAAAVGDSPSARRASPRDEPLQLDLVSSDPALDLALYHVKNAPFGGGPPLRERPLLVGETVYMVSWIQGDEPRVSVGQVQPGGTEQRLITDLATSWGASGSPILDSWGQIAGVQVAWNEVDDTSIGVPMTWILKQPWFSEPPRP